METSSELVRRDSIPAAENPCDVLAPHGSRNDSLAGYCPTESELGHCVRLLNQVWPDGDLRRSSVTSNDDAAAAHTAREFPPHSFGQEFAFGRFKLVRQLGQGGCGIVFLAYDERLKREVALKVPRPGALRDSAGLNRFRREAEVVAMLDHPGIVPVYEVGEFGSVTFIVSAFCRGQNLSAWIAQHGQTAPRQAASILRQLAAAVSHAHDRGVLHRDLKPENVLLEESANSIEGLAFVPRLTDFGLAKLVDRASSDTVQGRPLGTVGYMSPEQALGDMKQVGVQTDVYALGAILFELLAAKLLFDGEYQEVVRRIQSEEPKGLDQVQPPVPCDLVNICYKALQKDKAARYQSARELEADLGRFLLGQPVVARPIGKLEHFTRLVRRHPAVSALAAGLIFVVVFGVAGIIWQWRRANANALVAQQSVQRAEANLAATEESLYQFAWMTLESVQQMEPGDVWPEGVLPQLQSYLRRVSLGELPESMRQPLLATEYSINTRAAANRGNSKQVLTEYEKCLAIWKNAVAKFPENASYRRALALCLYCCTVYSQKSGLDESVQQDLTDARHILQSTANGRPFTDNIDLLNDLGQSFAYRHENVEAFDALRRALQECQSLSDGDPHEFAYQYRLALLHLQIGAVEMVTAQPTAALSDVTATKTIVESLLGAQPDDPSLALLATDAQLLLSSLHYQLHNYAMAGTEINRGIKFAEDAAAGNQQDNRWLTRLAKLYEKAGDVDVHTEHHLQAAQKYQRSADYWTNAMGQQALLNADFSKWEKANFQASIEFAKAKEPQLAKAAATRAIEVYQSMSDKLYEPHEHRMGYADCYSLLGDLNRGEGNLPAALANKQQAATLYREMLSRNATNATARDRLGRTLDSVAKIQHELSQQAAN
jgi:tetratricopeptide (TPR) repeat protein